MYMLIKLNEFKIEHIKNTQWSSLYTNDQYYTSNECIPTCDSKHEQSVQIIIVVITYMKMRCLSVYQTHQH